VEIGDWGLGIGYWRFGIGNWEFGIGERMTHVPHSRDAPRSCGTRFRVLSRAKDAKIGKEDWLLGIGERMAHVPQSRDAPRSCGTRFRVLSRTKVAKPRRGCGAQTRVGEGCFFGQKNPSRT
jgi:hypothetical protein